MTLLHWVKAQTFLPPFQVFRPFVPYLARPSGDRVWARQVARLWKMDDDAWLAHLRETKSYHGWVSARRYLFEP